MKIMISRAHSGNIILSEVVVLADWHTFTTDFLELASYIAHGSLRIHVFKLLIAEHGLLLGDHKPTDIPNTVAALFMKEISEKLCPHCNRGHPATERIFGDSANGYQCITCWEENETV